MMRTCRFTVDTWYVVNRDKMKIRIRKVTRIFCFCFVCFVLSVDILTTLILNTKNLRRPEVNEKIMQVKGEGKVSTNKV